MTKTKAKSKHNALLVQIDELKSKLKALSKIDEFVAGAAKFGWKVIGYQYARIKGVEKWGVDVQNEKGEVLRFNY